MKKQTRNLKKQQRHSSSYTLQEQLDNALKTIETLSRRLNRKMSVVKYAACPAYGYHDDIEPDCSKKYCYDIDSCEHKQLVQQEQVLQQIKKLLEQKSVQQSVDLTILDLIDTVLKA